MYRSFPQLEVKYSALDALDPASDTGEISGYASRFELTDQGGDIVQKGAYAQCLKSLVQNGRKIKLLWQHDPTRPIGVWDEVFEDDTGLFVKGRILTDVAAGREALALIRAGAIDGLSIGYRTKRAQQTDRGRMLCEIDLWEISLVTFPMLPDARVGQGAKRPSTTSVKSESDHLAQSLGRIFRDARAQLQRA